MRQGFLLGMIAAVAVAAAAPRHREKYQPCYESGFPNRRRRKLKGWQKGRRGKR